MNNQLSKSFDPSRHVLPLIILFTAHAIGAEDRWWPEQKLPRALVATVNQHEFPAPKAALQMMVQSVAGLAARAVNEGRGDELVWVNNGNSDLEEWRGRFLKDHPHVTHSGKMAPWDLVERFTNRGIIKGYILYRLDKSPRELNAHRREANLSVNIATSLAGLLDGIIVDEELESEAKSRGLKLLLDVRDKTQTWCFQNYKSRFSRRMLATQDPKKPHVRDFAIAHRVLTIYGDDETVRSAMAWLEPLSPILGWNGGDEFANTDLSSRYGHIQTATDWSMNLPVLMAGSERSAVPRVKTFDFATIDWSDGRSAVSFVDTDGDNVQWIQGNFFRHPSYWGDPARGKMPFGWSFCFAHLAQLFPQAIEYASAMRTTNDFFIEWGGGYYYPDHFGSARTNRWDLLAAHARRTWNLMKRTGTQIIGFNVARHDSPEALRAYEVFARETDGLLAILIFQYYPYEGGAGKTFWVKDRNGIEVPVITARYSIWENANQRERAGTPAKIAREIRDTIEQSTRSDLPRYDWVIAHVWSYFKQAPGNDENAENLPQETATATGGVRGYSPVVWCADRLPKDVRVVSPEELAWRIRMKHDAAQTQKFMHQLSR